MMLFVSRAIDDESAGITVLITGVKNSATGVFPFFFGLWAPACVLANNFDLFALSISRNNFAIRWVKYNNRFRWV